MPRTFCTICGAEIYGADYAALKSELDSHIKNLHPREFENDELERKKEKGKKSFWHPTRERIRKRMGLEEGRGARGWLEERFIDLVISAFFGIGVLILISVIKIPIPKLFLFIIPAGVGFFTYFSSRGKTALVTFGYGLLFFTIGVFGAYIINGVVTGQIFNIEWWLSKLNFVKIFGVPESYLETFKDGIRNTLSFLTPKQLGQKPQAEKIGGYQALQIKFGSKYTQYSIPSVLANDKSYSIPVTVFNPNSADSKLVIENFYIKTPNMDSSKYKLMCGVSDACNSNNPCKKIDTQTEEQLLITFTGGNSCTLTSVPYLNAQFGSKEECTQPSCTWKSRSEECYCSRARSVNNFTELCEEEVFGDRVNIGFSYAFSFSVAGSSEFRILDKSESLKIAPQPKIKTGSGPVDVTMYFIPDYVSSDKPRDAVKMLMYIVNKGGGTAKITEAKLEQPASLAGLSIDLTECEQMLPSEAKPLVVNNGEERPLAVCNIKFKDRDGNTVEVKDVGKKFSAPYVTLPVNAKIKYAYEKAESVRVSITKYFYNINDKATAGIYATTPGYCPATTP